MSGSRVPSIGNRLRPLIWCVFRLIWRHVIRRRGNRRLRMISFVHTDISTCAVSGISLWRTFFGLSLCSAIGLAIIVSLSMLHHVIETTKHATATSHDTLEWFLMKMETISSKLQRVLRYRMIHYLSSMLSRMARQMFTSREYHVTISITGTSKKLWFSGRVISAGFPHTFRLFNSRKISLESTQ
jgi:predicted ATP-grasp superfamily ATP-dependent carboligase